MKKIIVIVFVLALSLPTLAQQNSNLFGTLTDKYADKEGFSASQISSEMFDLYIKKKNIDEKSSVYEALKKLDNILVVSQSNLTGERFSAGYYSLETTKEKKDESKTDEAKLIHKEILSYYKNNNYTLFKTEKRMGEDVKIYIKKPNDKIHSLALVTNSSVATNLVELTGDIDLKTVSELNQALNLRGLENLYKIDNSSNAIFGYSAGRNGFSEERVEEMVARQMEMAEKQALMTKDQQAKFEEQAHEMAEKQMLMAEKYREMAEKYRREPIFLSYPGDTNTVYFLDGKKVKADKIKELNKEKIESVEVTKPEKDDDKTTIKIKTK